METFMPITNFRAGWHPGRNMFGIQISVQGGPLTQLQIDSPDEFISVLAVLNGPNPILTPDGLIVCQR
jgi:hypothetical protein